MTSAASTLLGRHSLLHHMNRVPTAPPRSSLCSVLLLRLSFVPSKKGPTKTRLRPLVYDWKFEQDLAHEGVYTDSLKSPPRDGVTVPPPPSESDQNYRRRAKTCDEKVYTYTATYNADARLLHLYGHHVAVLTRDGPDTYHMTEIGAYHMASLDTFRSGVAAFRYFRALAAKNRQQFIQEANRRQREEEEEEEGARAALASTG